MGACLVAAVALLAHTSLAAEQVSASSARYLISHRTLDLGGGRTRSSTLDFDTSLGGFGGTNRTADNRITFELNRVGFLIADDPFNRAPTLSAIAAQNGDGGSTPLVSFTVGDLETPAGDLRMPGTLSNPVLVPGGSIRLGGSGLNRNVQVLSAPGKTGTAVITLVVTDAEGGLASTPFTVTVNVPAPKLTPEIVWPSPVSIVFGTALGPSQLNATANVPGTFAYTPALGARPNAGTSSLSVTFTPEDTENYQAASKVVSLTVAKAPLTILRLSVTFSSPSLIRSDSILIDGLGSSRTLTAAPASGKSGVTSATLSVSDGEQSASVTFQLTVLAPNQPPAIELIYPWDLSVVDPASPLVVESKAADLDGAIQPVQWRILPRAEAKLENLLRQYEAVLWHQPSAAEVQPQDLNFLESLARTGRPLYFLGDLLLASGRRLPSGERDRWQNLIHLKPGGTSWLKQVTILDEASHPVIRNGPAGSVARFAYPNTVQQSGLQTGLPGEVVLGHSGTFDLLVAAVGAQPLARTFTHHLRLSGASGAFGSAEQAALFKNAIGWLLGLPFFPNLTILLCLSAQAVFPRRIAQRADRRLAKSASLMGVRADH